MKKYPAFMQFSPTTFMVLALSIGLVLSFSNTAKAYNNTAENVLVGSLIGIAVGLAVSDNHQTHVRHEHITYVTHRPEYHPRHYNHFSHSNYYTGPVYHRPRYSERYYNDKNNYKHNRRHQNHHPRINPQRHALPQRHNYRRIIVEEHRPHREVRHGRRVELSY